MNGINLHDAVRAAITRVHPDETVVLYQSDGFTNVKGRIVPKYLPPQTAEAQIQSAGDAALYHADRAGMNQTTVRAYLYAHRSAAVPLGVVRPLGRTGDLFRRADGTWWLIDAVTENFTGAGWVQVRATMQETPPDFTASEWYEAEEKEHEDERDEA